MTQGNTEKPGRRLKEWLFPPEHIQLVALGIRLRAALSVAMLSIYRLVVVALAAASGFTGVHLLEFCPSAGPDCHSDDETASTSRSSQHAVKSRWNGTGSELIQDLDQFRVSCKKLLEAFPIDEVSGNLVHTVKNCIFSKSIPTPLKEPLSLAAVSKDVIEGILDLDVADLNLSHTDTGATSLVTGQVSWVMVEHISLVSIPTGREKYGNCSLKGSGKTPYSRSGDGRAVIRSSVREFLCSEAMHFLGVPTSRAASLIVSEEPVFRDKFYNGNVKTERGAVVLRLAKSWFRIGSLEILSQSGETDLLRKLLNFVIDEHFPYISSNDPDKYLMFYSTVVNETAHLIGQWMSVGFAHGVCNTDNFSLLSITIDYGPFGFMESYNPNFIPNTSDDEGRYRIGAQADVGLFNLEKLLSALSPVFTHQQQEEAKIILKGFVNIYQTRIHQIFKAKLGLLGEEEGDSYLIPFLLQASLLQSQFNCIMMEDTESDFTMTFRQLSEAFTPAATQQELHTDVGS
ncbi:unnamed protein product [Pleuronectes platessa]|uniref:Selenoprotein O n=1 Tax=Pleuronectes platessa TaxID=8262 RepID=A0A9N7VHN9_PLEPL|nr:unnamed protein product [Pleuronectes platessa]